MTIETSRLLLRPFQPQQLLALIESVAAFETLTGWRLADGLRDFFVSGEVSPVWLERLRAATIADVWAHGFAVIERGSDVVVGSTGFKGPPDAAGMAEIAYGIAPDRQGRGYATEAAAGMTAFAFADPRVRLVRAHTLPTANASTRVLAKCGFHHVGEVIDPEDGLVWRWERARDAG